MPENWDAPKGRVLALHVAIVRPRSAELLADPLYLLAGGPGQAASDLYQATFSEVARRREIVLVDQRGTGRSGLLSCEAFTRLKPLEPPSEAEEDALIEACLAEFEADLATYNTRATVRDLEAVRVALGHEAINLYGVSYGTRVALTYLAQAPAAVRSVILDGVLPQDTVLGEEILERGPARARANMITRCAAEPSCAKRFPELAATLDRLEARLLSGPQALSVVHPRTAEIVDASLTWDGWTVLLRLLSYSSETMALLPLLVDRAAAGDFRGLGAQLLLLEESLASLAETRLQESVLCSEDFPFVSATASDEEGALGGRIVPDKGRSRGTAPPPDARSAVDEPTAGGSSTASEARASDEARYGGRALRALERLCRRWPVTPAPETFKAPVVSSTPVLLLSGEYDPVTPPEFAERARRTLSRSRHVVFAGQGHGVIARGCAPRLSAAFLRTLDPEGLDGACAAVPTRIGSFLGLAGPTP